VRRERDFALTILVLLLLHAILHVLGAGPLRDSFWGVHHYAFFPVPWLIAATVVLLGSCLLLRFEKIGWWNSLGRWPAWETTAVSRRWVWLVLMTVGGGVLFWLTRAGHVILGDGSILVVNIPQGEAFHPREPLTAILQQALYRLTSGWFATDGATARDIAQQSLALGSVLAGAFLVPVLFLLSRELILLNRRRWLQNPHAAPSEPDSPPLSSAASPDTKVWLAPATIVTSLILLTQGYIQLFCGYVENYTYYTLGTALYLWLALRYLRTGRMLLFPAAALILTFTLHLSAAIYFPSFLFLTCWGLSRAGYRLATLRDLALSALLVILAGWLLAQVASDYSLFGTLRDVARLALLNEEESAPGYMFSALHFRNFFNEQLLIGPLGLFLFLATVFALGASVIGKNVGSRHGTWREQWRGQQLGSRTDQRLSPWPAFLFLLIAGLGYLAASWLAGESNLGYPRNWDLLAPGSLTFTTAGLGLFFLSGLRLRAAVPVLLCALVLSLYHTVPWVALNTSFDRAFARLKTLPSEGGLTETNVARWYLLQGDRDQGKQWLQKALRINPHGNNAHYMLGSLHMEDGDFAAAAESFRRAVASRPDKPEYRMLLVDAYLSAGEYARAQRVCETLMQDSADDSRVWGRYGITLLATGQDQAARKILLRLRERAPADTATAALVSRFLLQQGDSFLVTQEWDHAVAAYQEALTWSLADPELFLNLGYALAQSGRNDEAVAVWQQGLNLYPRSLLMALNLGALLHALGYEEDAVVYLEQALALEPTAEQAAQIRALLETIRSDGQEPSRR
jgi:Flp pilus assembly protein TadD